MGGTDEARLLVPYAALSPPPSPSPIKGEGIEEAKSLLEIALDVRNINTSPARSGDAVPQMQSAQIIASTRTVAAQEWPLVSIVTPSYNHGLYIEATIQSVLQQDYPNLEYIVIDGGSQDDTVEILKRYGDRLCWISEPDHGQADAINKGFRMARGEILAWLNSDDTYLPGAVRQAVEYFQKHPDTSMVYGEGQHVDAAGHIIEPYTTEPFDYQRLSERCFICQPTVFFRAHVFRDIGPLDTNFTLLSGLRILDAHCQTLSYRSS